ncbi:low molecular weight protein-tyrosine-phosphatase [Paraburkholderia dioscoreae]|uniref:protein-tyrosine-phosphatase n=1 Tax=Paraburkholderia dioscoreae TaxID=2604047 RepID=A0A5Q4ZL97_9BURK|nr:low molecular weight protein-tyrosine-phosphatase [Paraburkholderia dioscoreae]VVD32647.1 protein-tyrosine phosphatase [Paraburkholderia dioscoreae]
MIDCILVVCEGNVCRSPMAQGLLARQFPGVRVMSAGLAALVGRSADPVAIELMAERDIDIGSHIAADLSLFHVRSADLVLSMTQEQRKGIETNYPFAKGKVYRLGEREGIDVLDPYRKGRAVFEIAVAQIERGVAHWSDAMVRLTH